VQAFSNVVLCSP